MAISDTVVLDRDWVLDTYAENEMRKYKRISQTEVIGNPECCLVICFYAVPVNKFPIRGCKGESNYSFLRNIKVTTTTGTPLSESSVPWQLRSFAKAGFPLTI